jgi:serine/threonine protein kinase
VYLSRHPNLPPVAIKVFNNANEARKEFDIAIDLCNNNKPKGLVKLLDHGFIRNARLAAYFKVEVESMFLVYEYISKRLKDLLEGPRMPTKHIIQIGIQLIESIESIHSAGYVHADIKLDNIMVDNQNKVYLIDYGCAQKYELPDKSHRPNLSCPQQFTNVHFGSKYALQKQTISRRDDLIQIVNNLMVLKNSFTPITNYLGPDNEDLDEFKRFKCESSAR